MLRGQRAFSPPRATSASSCRTKSLQFAAVVLAGKMPGKRLLLRQRFQEAQRLLKALHRHDPEAASISPGLRRVFPSRDEEEVGSSPLHADRLLLEAADRADPPVEEDLARRRDAVAAVDVTA